MDFFAQQDKARKKTKLLVFYFAIAVAALIVAVYFASLVIFTGVQAHSTITTANSRSSRFGIRNCSLASPLACWRSFSSAALTKPWRSPRAAAWFRK